MILITMGVDCAVTHILVKKVFIYMLLLLSNIVGPKNFSLRALASGVPNAKYLAHQTTKTPHIQFFKC